MSSDEPHSLAESLAQVTRNLGLARPSEVTALLDAWTTLVGAALADHTRPAALRNGTLTIEVDAGVWGAPVKYLGDTLISRANEILGAPVITALRVVVR